MVAFFNVTTMIRQAVLGYGITDIALPEHPEHPEHPEYLFRP